MAPAAYAQSSVMDGYDLNRDGYVTLKEYASVYIQYYGPLDANVIKGAFDTIDSNRDGYLTNEELSGNSWVQGGGDNDDLFEIMDY